MPSIHARLFSKRFLVLMLISLLSHIDLKAQPFPKKVHRIVFLGNSITYDGRYVTDVAAYLRVKYPRQNYEIINVGLPSETVSGLSEPNHADGKFPRPDLHERLSRVLQQTKPDLVIACYGMNDGIYLPWDESRFTAFRTGMQWLHDQVVNVGVSIIHVTPPVYDESRGQAQGYAAVLDRYAEWLLSQREAQQWRVLDLHFPMKTYLETQRQQNATFYLAEDGIHPQAQGHWLMAQQLLVGLGEDQAATATDAQASVAFHPKGAQLLELEAEKQALMKDAWLTATGHQRPGMKKGLPLPEAQQKAAALTKQQKAILRYCGFLQATEYGGTDSPLLFEEFVEVTFVSKTQFVGNFIDSQVTMLQPGFDQLRPVVGNVLLHGFLRVFFEVTAEVRFRQAEVLANGFRPDFFGFVNMILNVMQNVQSPLVGMGLHLLG